MMPNHAALLLVTFLAIVFLVALIIRGKLNSFIAVILASLFVGLGAGMKLGEIPKAFQDGVGGVLGSIAMVIALGTVLGKMLAESGGAARITRTFIHVLGLKRIHWAMALIAFLVGLPVFFAVGFVLLVPIVFALVKDTQSPLLLVGIPMVVGLAMVHALVPPHPGVMAAIGVLKADVGRTIYYSILIGLPATLLLGPPFGKFFAARMRVETAGQLADQFLRPAEPKNPPGFGLTLFTILLPVLLMLVATVADLMLDAGSSLREWGGFIGHPVVALTIAVLFSFYSFGAARGFNRRQILKFSEECLGPVAGVLLIVGAGGGFNRVLINGGVGSAISEWTAGWEVSPLILGWSIAATIRVAVGSATVAITTAAGLIVPILTNDPKIDLELLVIALGGGSMFASHVNDGGFWIVKEYFNMTVAQTFRTWTFLTSIGSAVILGLVLLVEAVR